MFDLSTTLIFQHLIDRVVQKSMLLEWRNEKLQIIMHDMDIKKRISAMPDVSGWLFATLKCWCISIEKVCIILWWHNINTTGYGQVK